MKVKILLNPYAKRWKARQRAPALEAACRAAGLDYQLSLIPGPGQGKQEAMDAVAHGFDAVVAAGGDGTVSEVVNGLVRAAGDGPTLPMGVFPIGTGNDFSDMSLLPRDLTRAAEIIAAGRCRQVDAGQVTFDGQVHYFDNNCALAMEPLVTLENVRMKRLSGNLRYVAAMILALAKLHAWQMKVRWSGGGYEGPAYLLSVCNSARTGGLFPMAPAARMDDGLFDFVFAPEIPKHVVMAVVLRLFLGNHIHHSRITYARTPTLAIESDPGTPIHADGELIAESAREITYQILPGKITLLTA